jgi:hypothetical protein
MSHTTAKSLACRLRGDRRAAKVNPKRIRAEKRYIRRLVRREGQGKELI